MDESTINEGYLKVKKEEFETSIHEPWIWEDKAGVLKRAADLLLDKYYTTRKKLFYDKGIYRETIEEIYDLQLLDVYYMLIGFSIENLVKKIVIMNNPTFEDNIKLAIKDHDIISLLKRNNIKGFEDYNDLFNTLSTYIIWKGRYTVPFSVEAMAKCPYHPNDPKKEVDELYQSLKKRLKQDAKLQQVSDDTGLEISQKEFLETKKEVIRFIQPKGKEISIKDISKALQSVEEIAEGIGCCKELIGAILWECLDDRLIDND